MNSKRGYVEVEIGGKKRTLHFSMNFWCHFTESLNIGLNDLDKYFTEGINVSTIIYDVGSWLEDFDSKQLTEVMNTLSQSRILGNDLNMGIQRNVKNQKKK
jgi:hypothetical protein